MPVSLSSGLASTLANLSAQQTLNQQAFANANQFLQLGSTLDFLGQFADSRLQGQSPTQALLGVQQNSLNPLTSNLGLRNFAQQNQALAPFAIGAALQGSPSLLNQLGSPLGIEAIQGSLAPADLLSRASPFFGQQGIGAVIGQNANDRFLQGFSPSVIDQLFNAQQQQQQQQSLLNRNLQLLQLNAFQPPASQLNFGNVQPVQQVRSSSSPLDSFLSTSSIAGRNGFTSPF